MRLCQFDHHNCNRKHHDKDCSNESCAVKSDDTDDDSSYNDSKLIPKIANRSKSIKPEIMSRYRDRDFPADDFDRDTLFKTTSRSYEKDKQRELEREKEIERIIESELQQEREKLKTTRRSRMPRVDATPTTSVVTNNLSTATVAPVSRARSRSRPRQHEAKPRADTPGRSKKISSADTNEIPVSSLIVLPEALPTKPRPREDKDKDKDKNAKETKEETSSQNQVKFKLDLVTTSKTSPDVAVRGLPQSANNGASSDSPKEAFTEMSFNNSDTVTVEEKKVRPRALKEIKNQSLINPAIILEKVDTLPIYKYHYKGGGKKFAMGPMPQDWHHAFPTDKDVQVLDPQDMSAVSLASIKALSQMVSTIWQTVLTLNTRLEALENINSRLDTLEAKQEEK